MAGQTSLPIRISKLEWLITKSYADDPRIEYKLEMKEYKHNIAS